MKKTVEHITSILSSHAIGIDVSKYEESFLLNSFKNKIFEKKINSENEYLSILQNSAIEATHFKNSLHNNYSEFFRNPLTFSVLERIILPSLTHSIKYSKQKEIRIWSAACASGQEPYSIAMLLEELKSDNTENFSYRIFATDQCDMQIDAAFAGKYESLEMNNVNMKRVKRWFAKNGNSFLIDPLLKKNIEFSKFDLLDKNLNSPANSIFGGFDIAVCSNLLFYYKPKFRNIILEKIQHSLSDGGLIITGEAEREIFLNHQFKEVFPQSAIFRV